MGLTQYTNWSFLMWCVDLVVRFSWSENETEIEFQSESSINLEGWNFYKSQLKTPTVKLLSFQSQSFISYQACYSHSTGIGAISIRPRYDFFLFIGLRSISSTSSMIRRFAAWWDNFRLFPWATVRRVVVNAFINNARVARRPHVLDFLIACVQS